MFKIIKQLKIIYIIILIPIIVGRPIYAANMISDNDAPWIKVFYTKNDKVGWKAIVKGKIISIGINQEIKNDAKNPVNIQSKTKATVRLYNPKGIKIGDTLYVINSKNLIVSRLKVKSLFKTTTFGFLLVGYGYLKYSHPRYRVIQRLTEEFSKYAYIYKARGDYFKEIGEIGKAIVQYNMAIQLDKGYPEAHLSLGYIYLNRIMLEFAYKEFTIAYKEISRLYDNEDKYLLLRGLVETRYKDLNYKKISNELRLRYTREGIKYSKEALKIYPKSKEVNFFLGMFYYKSPESPDVKAKEQFLKIIDLDPLNVDAYVALSELYYKHENEKKSRYYAMEALKIEPTNEKAGHMLKLLPSKRR